MNAVVVWLTKGGIVEHVASPEVDVVVIDFQNLEAGDPAPDMSDAHKALLREKAPSVLDDIAEYIVHYRCTTAMPGIGSWTSSGPSMIWSNGSPLASRDRLESVPLAGRSFIRLPKIGGQYPSPSSTGIACRADSTWRPRLCLWSTRSAWIGFLPGSRPRAV